MDTGHVADGSDFEEFENKKKNKKRKLWENEIRLIKHRNIPFSFLFRANSQTS